MKILLAHPGTQHSFALAKELNRIGCLSCFHTCLAFNSESLVSRIFAPVARIMDFDKQLQNRRILDVPENKCYYHPILELKAWWGIRGRESGLEFLRKRNDAFQYSISDRFIARADAIVGFDTSSAILGAKALEFEKTFLLEQTTIHPRSYNRVAASLREQYPEWKLTSQPKPDSEIEICENEHELAEVIIAPSNVVKASLSANGVASEKIRINPYGVDTSCFYPKVLGPLLSPLIFLFVGSLSAGKGLPLLLQVWKKLRPKNAELWIVGTGTVPNQTYSKSPSSIRWLGNISRAKIPGIFHRAHVFVFPSFFEGLARVQIEAAACGLPIIATTSSGGGEIVEEGISGFVIVPGSADQLLDRMNRFINEPRLALDMREVASKKTNSWSWTEYGNRWRRILNELNGQRGEVPSDPVFHSTPL